MNFCGYEQNPRVAACEGMRMMEPIVTCPKPRRPGLVNTSIIDHVRPIRCRINRQMEIASPRVGVGLMDILLAEGNNSVDISSPMASSPPFFFGSPPSRASNPLIQDARFGNDKMMTPLSSSPAPPSPSSSASPSSSYKGGGCARTKFGHKSPQIRIEGFDCLGRVRDRRNCSISAVA